MKHGLSIQVLYRRIDGVLGVKYFNGFTSLCTCGQAKHPHPLTSQSKLVFESLSFAAQADESPSGLSRQWRELIMGGMQMVLLMNSQQEMAMEVEL